MPARKPPEHSRAAVPENAGRLEQSLAALSDALHARAPDDLSALSPDDLPAEIRPLADCINDLMRRLAHSQQMQKHFISNAAHRLRDPLTGLKMQAELALTEDSPDTLRSLLTQLVASTDGLARLVQQLLTLARIEEASAASKRFGKIDLAALARKSSAAHLPAARERHIDLGFADTRRAVMIDGDAVLLRQMLDNLIDNAIRHGAPGGCVTVRLRDDNSVQLEVEDNGPGIPAEEHERIMQPFARILGNPSSGSGLGLTIACEIARQHRAELQLLPGASGQGAVVRIVFAQPGK